MFLFCKVIFFTILILQLSTVVKQHDVPKFMELFSKVMKSNMDGLKKIKKTKNKTKAAQG